MIGLMPTKPVTTMSELAMNLLIVIIIVGTLMMKMNYFVLVGIPQGIY